MNYYPFHLGDYASHTAHLEPMEDLAYRRMLDLYYLRESALPQDPKEVARLIRMRANVEDVEVVLREFFTNNDGDGWIHIRCEAEISKMQDRQAKAKASAAASVKARSTNAQRTLNERSTDVELPTPTPTPNTNTPIPPAETPGAVSGRSAAVSLPTWLTTIKAMGEQPMPETDPVFDYAEQAGIPMDMMRLCWVEFRDRYSQPNAKRYKDWRSVYRKAVRANWFRLWRSTPDGYVLTTEGQQAQRALDAKQGAAA